MRLTKKQTAPDFSRYDLYDIAINSQALRGKKVLSSFYEIRRKTSHL